MQILSSSQLKLLSDFFSNMAVVWFAAAFIGAANLLTVEKSLISGFLSLFTGIWLVKEAGK